MKSEKFRFPVLTSAPKSWHAATKLLLASQGQIACANSSEDDAPCIHPEGEHTTSCCRRHAVVLPGVGHTEYPFPTTDELVAGAIAYFNGLAREYEKHGKKFVQPEESLGESDGEMFLAYVRRSLSSRPTNLSQWHRRRRLREQARAQASRGVMRAVNLPKIPINPLIPEGDGVTMTATAGPVLRIAAGTLAKMMHDGRFKSVIARQFDPFKGACNWALNNMPKKFHAPAASLRDHLLKLEDIYAQSLPRVIQFLGAQYPQASEEELLDAAVSVLNEQLNEILYVLQIWTDSFTQRMYGFYPQLDYVHFTVEQANHLFHNGDLTSDGDGGVKTRAFHLNDCFMARFSDQGPATIPGGRGPVGAHAIEVPFDEADLIVGYLPLYLHEFRHDFYNDVDGLADNMTEAVVKAITAAHAAGKFKFSSDKMMLGKQPVRMIDMITQVYAQTLSETDADIAGGVSLSGEAFMYSMLATFCAFNLRGQSAFDANRMLRHGSYFAIGEQGELGIEPHMPDYMRAYVVAAALDCIGFHAEADECRMLADQAAGVPLPKNIVWRNMDPKSKFKFDISIPMSDLKQVAPVVVDAIFNALLPSLGGKSTAQLVNWNRKRQDKVDALVRNLVSGKSDIPWEMGDFWAPYVAAADIKAKWTLWKSGRFAPQTAALFTEKNSRKMMDQVRARFIEKQAAEAAAKAKVTSPAPVAAPPTTGLIVPTADETAKYGTGVATTSGAPVPTAEGTPPAGQ